MFGNSYNSRVVYVDRYSERYDASTWSDPVSDYLHCAPVIHFAGAIFFNQQNTQLEGSNNKVFKPHDECLY